jgi:hypothetical protein
LNAFLPSDIALCVLLIIAIQANVLAPLQEAETAEEKFLFFFR